MINKIKSWWNGFSYRKPDEYTPFRYQLKKISNKNRKGCSLTLQDIKELWESQEGICPLTGKLLKLKDFRNVSDTPDPYDASIDRLDNSLPYQKGNVRFTATMANYARNDFTDSQVIEFCVAVVNNMKRV